MSDPKDGRDRIDDDDAVIDEPKEVAGGSEARRAQVYDRPQTGGRSAMSWILIALVVIALLLWLVF